MNRLVASEAGLFGLVALVGLLACLTMPVFAQESYYWTYAQHPDLSYFDHPPMVAWLIWLGTAVFGDGALGIRIGTLLCSVGVTWCGLRLLAAFGADLPARRAWIALGIGVPMYASLHVLANPDPPLCAFWAATLLALWRARDGGLGWWLLAGVAAGLALLSKYSAVFLAVGGAIVLLCDPALRRQLRRPGPYLGVVTAAVTFLPVVVWNVRNDFESFRFQTGGRWEKARLGLHWLLECVVGQLGVMNPGLVLVLPFALAWLWRRARGGDLRARWLLAFGVPLPAFFLANAVVMQVKINWFLPAYLPLFLGILLWWREQAVVAGASGRGSWLPVAAKWSVAAVACLLPLAPLLARVVPQSRGSTWSGWETIAAAALQRQQQLERADGAAGKPFFFGSDYKDAAQLQRALTILGGGRLPAPVLAQNVFGEPALQFDHWDPPKDHVGADAVFVLARPEMRPDEVTQAMACFRAVEAPQRVGIDSFGVRVLDADIYVCRGYRGPQRAAGAPRGH